MREKCVVTISEGLATVPISLTTEQLTDFRSNFTKKEEEWIVFSIVLMGFLNKFMDAVGVQLEQEAIDDVGSLLHQTGWSHRKHLKKTIKIQSSKIKTDNLKTFFKVLKEAPGAIRLEKKWTKDVPNSVDKAAVYLQKHIGYSFPIIHNIKQGRIIRTLTTILKDNLNKETSIIGLPIKVLLGYIYALEVGNKNLILESIALAKVLAPVYGEDLFFSLKGVFTYYNIQEIELLMISLQPYVKDGILFKRDIIILLLAKGASSSPAFIENDLLSLVEQHLTPEIVVEVIVWISVQQAIHRLDSYYEVSKQLF